MKYMIGVTPTNPWILEVEQMEVSRTFCNRENFCSKRKIGVLPPRPHQSHFILEFSSFIFHTSPFIFQPYSRSRSLTLKKLFMIFTNSIFTLINPSMLMGQVYRFLPTYPQGDSHCHDKFIWTLFPTSTCLHGTLARCHKFSVLMWHDL